jgi:hypothetical protein
VFFSVFPTENKIERPPFWHNWGDGCRIAGAAEHPHRTRLPGFIEKMAEVPVSTKLVLDQIAASVPEIMDPLWIWNMEVWTNNLDYNLMGRILGCSQWFSNCDFRHLIQRSSTTVLYAMHSFYFILVIYLPISLHLSVYLSVRPFVHPSIYEFQQHSFSKAAQFAPI